MMYNPMARHAHLCEQHRNLLTLTDEIKIVGK